MGAVTSASDEVKESFAINFSVPGLSSQGRGDHFRV